MAGRPAKPNKIARLIKIDKDVWAAIGDAAKLIGPDRSQLIEDVMMKYLPIHITKQWRAEDKAKRRAAGK